MNNLCLSFDSSYLILFVMADFSTETLQKMSEENAYVDAAFEKDIGLEDLVSQGIEALQNAKAAEEPEKNVEHHDAEVDLLLKIN